MARVVRVCHLESIPLADLFLGPSEGFDQQRFLCLASAWGWLFGGSSRGAEGDFRVFIALTLFPLAHHGLYLLSGGLLSTTVRLWSFAFSSQAPFLPPPWFP